MKTTNKKNKTNKKTVIESFEILKKSINDFRATWVFLFLNYDFRYNPNTNMVEAKEKSYKKSPCGTNLSVYSDFRPIDKAILFTWSEYLKRKGINVSSTRILKLIRVNLSLWGTLIRMTPKTAYFRKITGLR